jgi:hypothetical protein
LYWVEVLGFDPIHDVALAAFVDPSVTMSSAGQDGMLVNVNSDIFSS